MTSSTRALAPLLLLILVCSHARGQEAQPYRRLNTPGDDYALAFRSTCDGAEAWFTTSVPGAARRSRRIVVSAVGRAGDPRELPAPVNQPRDRGPLEVYLDGAPTFASCDPDAGVFTSNRPHEGRNMDNDLYELRRDGDAWRVRRLDEVSSAAWDDSPALSSDGRFLYFASDRAAPGSGRTDLYVARRLDGGWSAPVLLSSLCTPEGREGSPCIGIDGRLYWATDRSGDYDIWSARLDPATGEPDVATAAAVALSGVNRAGSDEGHPAFSPGGGWLVFTSNRTAGRDYDLYHVQAGTFADTVRIRALLRTSERVAGVDEPDDITRPLPELELTATDLDARAPRALVTDRDGVVEAIFPRAIGREPGDDRRVRRIEVRARTDRGDWIASTDTLLFAMGYTCTLAHTLFVWDTTALYTPACRQNFPVTNVEFFITGYWCPTSSRYAGFAPCQSPFTDQGCAVVPSIPQPCDDNELYDYSVVPARIDRARQPGLCVRLNEIDEHGQQWARTVDSAIDGFVDNMRVGLLKPCIERAILEGKAIRVEIVGWTDPRTIDFDCLYTGPDIDFANGSIELDGLASKRWVKGGILARGTHFRESPAGGNQMLSDLRAYYTARMLDSVFSTTIPLYRDLRGRGQITVVARGEAVSQAKIAMERQRSVNVIINADVDQSESARRRRPGGALAICGGACVGCEGAP